MKDGSISNFDKINLHIHHVQFDTQASDGVITGYSYEMSIRPYKAEDPQLVDAANAGDTTLHLASVAKFHLGAYIAVGEGLDAHRDPQDHRHRCRGQHPDHRYAARQRPPGREYAGVEFVQERWYPDVALDNIFWHDHVDGIHNWGHGLVGQFIIEPKGSTYHDPKTGAVVDSGTIVDIHTNPTSDPRRGSRPASSTAATASSRCGRSTTTPLTDSTLNLKAEPWADRATVPQRPVAALQLLQVGRPDHPTAEGVSRATRSWSDRSPSARSVDTLHFDGLRAIAETRALGPDGKRAGSPVDTVHAGHQRAAHPDHRRRRRWPQPRRRRLPVQQRHRPPLPARGMGHPPRAARRRARPAAAAGPNRARTPRVHSPANRRPSTGAVRSPVTLPGGRSGPHVRRHGDRSAPRCAVRKQQ